MLLPYFPLDFFDCFCYNQIDIIALSAVGAANSAADFYLLSSSSVFAANSAIENTPTAVPTNSPMIKPNQNKRIHSLSVVVTYAVQVIRFVLRIERLQVLYCLLSFSMFIA